MSQLQESGRPPGFKTVLCTFLRSGGNWPVLPNPVVGSDWVSGKTFFIRNRRQPGTYWWVHDTHIHTSEQRRTKFRIDLTGTAPCKDPVILVRKDSVRIAAIPETTTSAAVTRGVVYISKGRSESGRLEMAEEGHSWLLEELLITRVGVRWVSDRQGHVRPELTHMPNGGSDEWELV